jgi:hypothetical protein
MPERVSPFFTVWRTERLVGFFLLEEEPDFFLVPPELRRALDEDEPPLWDDRQLV